MTSSRMVHLMRTHHQMISIKVAKYNGREHLDKKKEHGRMMSMKVVDYNCGITVPQQMTRRRNITK